MFAFIDGQAVSEWAAKVGASHQIPRLIRRLIWATLKPSEIRRISFPAGADTYLSGFDGQLDAAQPSPWTPEGLSVWELSVRRDKGGKAERDYTGRRDAIPVSERNQLTYVAVSARRWQQAKRESWIDSKKQDGWKDVSLITAVELAEWLERAPALAVSFAQEIGRLPSGVMPLEFAWKAWSQRSHPATTQELVLVGRAEQQTKLVNKLAGDAGAIAIEADFPNEAYGFNLAVLTGSDDEEVRDRFASKSLVVTNSGWAQALSGHQNLIVIQQTSELDLTSALRHRHHVLIPLGREDVRGRDPIRLDRASRFDFARALEKLGFSDSEADRLAYECGRSITIFHRRRPAAQIDPPRWSRDPALLPVLMAGRWDRSNANDREALARLAGVERYENLQQQLTAILNVSDPPLVKVADTFALTAPPDAFELCTRLLTTAHFERFARVVGEVFAEIDPALALPPERRPYAAMYGSIPKHSPWLRHGLAETLLLIAVRGEILELDLPDPQGFVDRLVRELPGLSSDTRLLECLDRELPMLVEAAPEPFLQALERLLEGLPDAVRELLTEAPGILFGRAKHTGLLWGIEILAWAPERLPRVASILARMAELDPGGKWANRPINSLRDIFLSWRPSTNAPLRVRLQVLDFLLDRHPEIGWELLTALLPKLQDSTSGTAKPRWRDDGSERTEALTKAIIEEARIAFVTRALDRVGSDLERWKVILGAVPMFRPVDRDRAVELLDQLETQTHEFEKRSDLENVVADFVRHHERFHDAIWALSADALIPFKSIAERLRAEDPVERHAWLFEKSWLHLPKEKGRSHKQVEDEARKAALREIIDQKGVGSAVSLASRLENPGLVLEPLIEIADSVEMAWGLLSHAHQFPAPLAYLGITSIIALHRFNQAWRNRIQSSFLESIWSNEEMAALIGRWPFERTTWQLAEAQGAAVADPYWRTCWANLRSLDGHDLVHAVDRLIAAGRAAELPSALYHRWPGLPSETWLRVIDACADILRRHPKEDAAKPDVSSLRFVFEHLAQRADTDEGELARREYAWLPLIIDVGNGKKHVPALYRILARDPGFFAQLLRDAYRGEGEPAEDEPSDEQRSHADAAHRIFMQWHHVPGFQQPEKPDVEALKQWVREARRLAVELDRGEIGDLMIGRMLAYAPNDTDDGAWPHRAIRDVIEDADSADLESGIRSEQMNKRGVSTRGLTEGGAQERDLAAQARAWAAVVGPRSPRTERLLRRISDMWDRGPSVKTRRPRSASWTSEALKGPGAAFSRDVRQHGTDLCRPGTPENPGARLHLSPARRSRGRIGAGLSSAIKAIFQPISKGCGWFESQFMSLILT